MNLVSNWLNTNSNQTTYILLLNSWQCTLMNQYISTINVLILLFTLYVLHAALDQIYYAYQKATVTHRKLKLCNYLNIFIILFRVFKTILYCFISFITNRKFWKYNDFIFFQGSNYIFLVLTWFCLWMSIVKGE